MTLSLTSHVDIEGTDQLCQRVAFALSEILVISVISSPLRHSQFGVADYHDTLTLL